jgi:hypothetical protein
MYEIAYEVTIEYPGDDESLVETCNTYKYAICVADEHIENGAIVSIKEVERK